MQEGFNIENKEFSTDEVKGVDDKKKNKITTKTKECKVLRQDLNKGILYFDFNGYGIEIECKNKIETKYVAIKYSSEIGKPDFTFSLDK